MKHTFFYTHFYTSSLPQNVKIQSWLRAFVLAIALIGLVRLPLAAQSVYVNIAPYIQAPTSGLYSIDVTTGILTPVQTPIAGYQVALGLNPEGNKFYLSETPQDAGGVPGIVHTLSNPPVIGETPTATAMTIIGPRMCLSTDGQYLYSVHTVVPGFQGLGFLRRSSVATGVSQNAKLKNSANVHINIEQNGDIIMAGDGLLYFTDGKGRFFKINPNTATWDTSDPGYAGEVSTTQLGIVSPPSYSYDLYYCLAMASDGNLYAIGKETIYKFDLSSNPLRPMASGVSIKLAQAGLPATSIAVDAASKFFLPLWHTVSGYVYHDRNRDGIRSSATEGGIGQVLYVSLVNTATGQIYATVPVDALTGFYYFDTVPNGSYTAVYSSSNAPTTTTVPATWVNTTTTMLPVAVQNANITEVNFGLVAFSPLSAQLADLSATKQGEKQVLIKWVTASERNNSFFSVERSNDGENFETIGLPVAGKGTSLEPTFYQMTDERPVTGYNYYRIKQVDFDGKAEDSRIVSIFFAPKSGQVFVFPNPVNTDINLALKGVALGDYQFDILNLHGIVVYSSQASVESENYQYRIESKLLNGIYFIRTRNLSTAETFLQKFIVEDLR